MLWGVDWAWGLPMTIVVTIFHVCGLVLLQFSLVEFERRRTKPRSITYFLFVFIYIANAAIIMHALEAYGWAMLYVAVDAIPDTTSALLYSLNAFTSYGHESSVLERHWRLLGAMEAMNGVLIFGLTTAFLFAALTQLRPVRVAKRHADRIDLT